MYDDMSFAETNSENPFQLLLPATKLVLMPGVAKAGFRNITKKMFIFCTVVLPVYPFNSWDNVVDD